MATYQGGVVYNATAVKSDASGRIVSVEAVEYDGLQVIRAAGLWAPPFDATYQKRWLAGQFKFVDSVAVVDLDPVTAMKRQLRGEDIVEDEQVLADYRPFSCTR
jgi:hypothetical protein